MSFASDLVLDDTYVLDATARTQTLALIRQGADNVISSGSDTGTPGANVHFDCTLTLMGHNSAAGDAIVLVEVDPSGHAKDVFVAPLAPLVSETEYRLIDFNCANPAQKLAQLTSASIACGTRIMLANGKQCPVENLKVGDPILTRDNGNRPLRWIGKTTQRAIGMFSPVRVPAGALNNAADVFVSPEQRFLVYQRDNAFSKGSAELWVKARHLLSDPSLTRMQGGFVDYFHLLFDAHEVIFAEGIAVESLRADGETHADLGAPPKLALSQNRISGSEDFGRDVQQPLLNRQDAARMLRYAARGASLLSCAGTAPRL